MELMDLVSKASIILPISLFDESQGAAISFGRRMIKFDYFQYECPSSE